MILPLIVSQHAEKVSFLWLLRSYGARAPHFRLSDLCDLDERVEANLDGLRVAEEAGWTIAKEQLTNNPEPGEMFAAGVLAFESADGVRCGEVLRLLEESPALARAAIAALGWTAYEAVRTRIQDLVRSEPPVLRRIGIGAIALHRQNPGDVLPALLRDQEAAVRARALKASGELGLVDHRYSVLDACEDADLECAYWAAWSATLFGDRRAMSALRAIAEGASSRAERAADLAGRALERSEATAWQQELVRKPKSRRIAIQVAGSIGDPAFIPWLIEQLAVPEFMRVAGESLSCITGIDFALERMTRPKPDGFDPGPNEDAADANVEMEADQDLPFPNPELVERWWSEKRKGLQVGTRHLLGQPVTRAWLENVLRTGKQRQRAAAALELVLLRPGQALFEVRARGHGQLEALR